MPEDSAFQPRNPDWERLAREAFANQSFMALLGVEVGELRPGYCELRLPYRNDLLQQNGLFHGGIVGTLADNVGGGATGTLAPPGAMVLTVEYKLNLLTPARGDYLLARGQVLKAGRTLTVVRSDVYGVTGEIEKLCAPALVTVMTLESAGRD